MNRFNASADFDIVDVRSPSEYTHAHIDGAINVELLDDAARHEVGVIYKQQGQQAAIIKGFELSGGKFDSYIKRVISEKKHDDLIIYCWRGGLRSRIMSWLLTTAGIPNIVIEGGYKSFRNACLHILSKKYNFIVLGGATGSGKTTVLEKLKAQGENVVDLEALANHRGSAFGGLGLGAQPSAEHFENLLALRLQCLPQNDLIWIENESRSIGSLKIPNGIYDQMRESNVVSVEMPVSIRKEIILKEYGNFSTELLAACTSKLSKKLGGARLKQALLYLQEHDLSAWLDILLEYYDENYSYSNSKRSAEKSTSVPADHGINPQLIQELIGIKQEINRSVLSVDGND